MTQRTSINASAAEAGRKTIDQFSWMRIIACFAIILLHSLFASNVYFEETITKGELLWSTTAENLLMWAVPCFLMVTGVLLLDPEKDIPAGKIFDLPHLGDKTIHMLLSCIDTAY